jgi:hypothetical protein
MILRILAILFVLACAGRIARAEKRLFCLLCLGFMGIGTAHAVDYSFTEGTRSSFLNCPVYGYNVVGHTLYSTKGWTQSGTTWTCATNVTLGTGDRILPSSSITLKAEAGIALNGNNTIGSASVPVNLTTTYGNLTTTGVSTVYGNLTTSSGAVSLTGTTVNGTLTTNGTLTISGGGITGNVSAKNGITSTNGAEFGGNVTATNGTLTLTGGSVAGAVHSGCCVVTTNNTNVGNGVSSGAVNGSGGSTVIINGGTVSGNILTNGGSGISINNGANVTGNVTSNCCTVVINNSTVTGNITSNGGSGVQIQNGSTITGNVDAPSYQAPATVVDQTSIVHGTCDSQTNSSSDPGSYDNRCDGGAAVAPHHLELSLSSASGLTCMSTTLTIKACADVACGTLYTGGVSGTLGKTGTPTVNWWDGTGFSIGAGGSVTKSIQVATPGSVVLEVTGSSPAAGSATTCDFGSPACTFTAADAGFRVSAPEHIIAESTPKLTVQAVKKADNSSACVAAFTGAKTVNLECAYVNPTTGTKPVRVGGTALNAAANVAGACDTSGRGVSLNFDASGTATPDLEYADVGEVSVTATYTGTAGSLEAGLNMNGSGSFIAAPVSFSFSNITAGPIRAGREFSATVTSLNAAGAATPNFGRESAAEGVTLASTLVIPSLVTYPLAANPALGGGAIAGGLFNAGAASPANLTWSEAGSITLAASLSNANGYLNSGLHPTGTSGTLRFIADHFNVEVLTVAGVPMACPSGLVCPLMTDSSRNSFVYSGQPFAVKVYARNMSDGPTLNYSDQYELSKSVALSAYNNPGSDATPSGAGTLGNNTASSSLFVAGEATITGEARPSYAFTDAQTSPVDIHLRATEINGDVVTSLRDNASESVEGGVKVASGRGMVPNAYGSELLPLPINNVEVQYYNGTSWVNSSTDITSLAVGDVNISNCLGNLGSLVPPCITAGSAILTNGVGMITLNAPGVGKDGSVDVTLNGGGWPTWLPSTTGRATFGIYKGNSKFIYIREQY